MNRCVVEIVAYFEKLVASDCSATTPALPADACTCEGARVSGTVTSHAMQRPLAHGTIVTPSGRFPSVRVRPVGSLWAGILAGCNDLHTTSLRSPWRGCLPALLWHARPCVPLASTWWPHTHTWGLHRLAPSLTPTATLMTSSAMRSPTDVMGSASSHAPDVSC